MSPEAPSQKTQICPTCGTRLSASAVRCPVCGTDLKPEERQSSGAPARAGASMQAQRMPELTLSLPVALALLVLFLAVGGAVVYIGWGATNRADNPTEVPTHAETSTASPIPTAAELPTLAPSASAQPPLEYTVALGDTCGGIAVTYGISVQSLIILNNLPVACNNLSVGKKLKVPYPTATPLPAPTNTYQPADATQAACDKVSYTVQENDTLSTIAANYGVPQQAIKDFNRLATDSVVIGRTIIIPLCVRGATPGPTPTPTIPPPYRAPDLLLPSDGAAFTLANDVVILQWASIGTLRQNEAYEVVVEDITAGQGHPLVDYVTDTKYIVPTTLRPKDTVAHEMRWWISPVRQSGLDEHGQPTWNSAGEASEKRDFTWMGEAVQATPAP